MIVQIFLLVFEYVYSITGQETVITGRVDSEFRIWEDSRTFAKGKMTKVYEELS